MTDRVEKTIDINASLEKVWRSLTDHEQFGQWFRVKLDQPFVAGEVSTGVMTCPGFERLAWRAEVKAIEPMRLFSFTWRPYAVDPERDYSGEPQTLVVFTLEPVGDGVRLTVVESGFDGLPPDRRDEALRMNDGGWAEQVRNVAAHAERGDAEGVQPEHGHADR